MSSTTKRPRRKLAVDLDGFLVEFYGHIAAWHLGTNLEDATSIVRREWRSPMLEVNWPHLTGQQAGELVTAFYAQFDFANCQPIFGRYRAMAELARTYDLGLVTSNAHVSDDVLLTWLDKWFRYCFTCGVTRTNMWGSKSEAMRENGYELLLEDRRDYAEGVANGGLLAVVGDRYIWSLGPNTDRIRHVSDNVSPLALARVVADLLAA